MDEGQNYTAFSSRGLLDMIGDLNDKALEASRMKDFIGVLGGRFFNWAQRKSLFPLHLGIKCCALEMAAAGAPRFDAGEFWCGIQKQPKAMRCVACKRPHLQEVRRPHCPPMGANARTEVVHCNGRMRNFRRSPISNLTTSLRV